MTLWVNDHAGKPIVATTITRLGALVAAASALAAAGVTDAVFRDGRLYERQP